MADLWAQQYVAFEAIYASRFSTKFNIHRIYSKNALGGEEGGRGGISQIVKLFPLGPHVSLWRT